MRIENGFARFEIGEKVNVQLIQIKYTKNNHRPYAVCEGGEGRFNVNIKDSDTILRPGRYQIHCTGINEAGFCYVELHKFQHYSWDKRDEAMNSVDQLRNEVQEEIRLDDTIDIAYSINLTKHYKQQLKYHSNTVEEHINKILQELYQHYGKLCMDNMECEEVDLS